MDLPQQTDEKGAGRAGQETGQGGELGLRTPAPSTTSPLAVTSSGDGR